MIVSKRQWCSHCAQPISIGAIAMNCDECLKISHKFCYEKIPPRYCGLTPKMADEFTRAVQLSEKKMRLKEIEDAEKERMKLIELEVESQDIESHIPPRTAKSMVARQNTRNIKKAVSTYKKSNALTIDDFLLKAVIGRGAFGKVMLVTDKITKKIYALKTIKKDHLRMDELKSMKAEKFVLQLAGSSRHPFLVNLHSSFYTTSRVFFVMEYVPGGDLLTRLQIRKRFAPKLVRFYACEVLLAIQFLHENNIIYRYWENI